MEFDVKANVGQAKQSIDQIGPTIDNASKAIDRANKKQFRPLAPGVLEELREYVKLLERAGGLASNMPGIGGAAPQSPAVPAPARAPDPSSRPGDNDDETPSSTRSRRHRGRWSNHGEFGTTGRFFNAFSSSVGGPASSIAGEAMAGARGAGGGFSAGGLLRGGLIGAGLFGAFKAGQAISEGYESAKTLALEMDKLKRQMGDIGVSFNVLTSAAESAAHGLEINTVESGKLMSDFNRLSGGVKDTSEVMEGTRSGVGMSKAFGLDPSAGVSFLANIRNITRSGSTDGDRKLALMIGDVVTRSGMNARADDVLQAVQSFAAATSRISLTNPNLAGFGGMYAGMVGSRIPGMTPELAAAMLGQANSAMTNMGAYGEASEAFTLSAFGKNGAINPIQAKVLAEGGLFGNRAGAFGKGSVYRQYMISQGMKESEVDKLLGSDSGMTNYEAIRRQLDAQNVHPDLKAEMAKNYFGLSSTSQAMAMLTIKPEEIGKTEKMLGSRGINLKDYNETGIVTLSKIANAGGVEDLQGVATDMLGRKGKGALSAPDQQRLLRAMEEAKGDPNGFKKLQDVLTDLAADKDKQETLGSQMLDQQKRIESAMTSVGKELLGPLTDIKSVLMAGFGVSETKARERVLDIRKKEITDEYAGKIKPIDDQLSSAKQSLLEAKALRMLGAPRSDELVQGWEDKIKELEAQKQAIVSERDGKIAKADADYKSETAARNQIRQIQEGEPTGQASSNARGVRNNNPGNIAKTSSAWDGEVTGSDSRFKSFDTPENGIRAIGRNLLAYKSKGFTTVADIINRWAPPSENNTSAYIARVCKELGVGPNDQIDVSDPKVMRALATAIISHENGGNPYNEKQISAGINSALGLSEANTPLPDNDPLGKVPPAWRDRAMNRDPMEFSFHLYDKDKRAAADPIKFRVPMPWSSGT